MPIVPLDFLIPAGTGLAGYAISAWRNRIVPLVGLEGFHYHCTEKDEIELPGELANRIQSIVGLPYQCLDLATVHEAELAGEDAEYLIASLPKLIRALNNFNRAMGTSLSPSDCATEIRRLWRTGGYKLIPRYIINNAVSIPEPTSPQVLKYVLHEDKGGCFLVDMQKWVLYVGSEFRTKPFRRESMEPLARLMCSLDSTSLLKFGESLLRICREQETIARSVSSELGPIVNNYSRWFGGLTISNVGRNPLLLFPEECLLIIEGPNLNPIKLPCIFSILEGAGRRPVSGSVVVKSESTLELSFRTKAIQREVPGGSTLKLAFQEGMATARMQIKYKSRDFPIKWDRKTSRVPFALEKREH